MSRSANEPVAVKPSLKPGSTIGLLGGGQLGMFFTQAAQKLGYRVVCFCQREDEPVGKFADELVLAPFDDTSAIKAFVEKCSVVTLSLIHI